MSNGGGEAEARFRPKSPDGSPSPVLSIATWIFVVFCFFSDFSPCDLLVVSIEIQGRWILPLKLQLAGGVPLKLLWFPERTWILLDVRPNTKNRSLRDPKLVKVVVSSIL